VDRESLTVPESYAQDRLFVYVRHTGAPDPRQDQGVDAVERAGHPVVRIGVGDLYDIGKEFYRWEFATAVAGAVIGIHPFDQPDVEASKVATRKLTTEYERIGKLPEEVPIFEEPNIKLFADDHNASVLREQVGDRPTLTAYLKSHLNRIQAGDYFALLAYVEMNEAHELVLQAIRHTVRDRKRVATCLGFGPRFLHSTGQAYKGGPNSGVFLQVTCDDAVDLPVPDQHFTFGVVKAAQARGDFQVLAERHRRALRVHLGPSVGTAFKTFAAAIKQAMQ
jgi:transaldolase/glucose-6-phosphate isomerase